MAFVATFGALGAWIPQSSLGNAEALAIWHEKVTISAATGIALAVAAAVLLNL